MAQHDTTSKVIVKCTTCDTDLASSQRVALRPACAMVSNLWFVFAALAFGLFAFFCGFAVGCRFSPTSTSLQRIGGILKIGRLECRILALVDEQVGYAVQSLRDGKMNLASQLMKLCTDYVWHTVTWQRITPTRTRLNTCLNSMIHMRLTTTTLVEIALCNWFRELRPDTTCSVVATSLKSWRWSLIVSFRGRTLLPLNMYAPWTVLWKLYGNFCKLK